jgi:hypothetical protein
MSKNVIIVLIYRCHKHLEIKSRIWDSHSCGYEEFYLLELSWRWVQGVMSQKIELWTESTQNDTLQQLTDFWENGEKHSISVVLWLAE